MIKKKPRKPPRKNVRKPPPKSIADAEEEMKLRTAELRNRAHLTQEMVAEKLGVLRNTYVKWEQRSRPGEYRRPMPHPYIIPFCDLVGCSIEEFFTGKDTTAQRAIRSALRRNIIKLVE